MNTNEKINEYKAWKEKLNAYSLALTVIEFDKETIAPVAGAPYRDHLTAYLAGEAFSFRTDPEMISLIKDLMNDPSLSFELKTELELEVKEIDKIVSIPKDEYVAYQELQGQSFEAWRLAKSKKDYKIFEPVLKKMIESTKELVSYRHSDLSIYDRMLDDYEPGWTMKRYDEFFAKLQTRLVPLIAKVKAAKPIDESFLHLDYPKESQKQFTQYLLKYLGYDPSWGYQGESEHPFTDWNCENDIRTTTKYLPNEVSSAILSTVHEVGHAFYAHDVDPKFDGTILFNGVSSGMHESQSRLAENYLGRSLPFWQANYAKLQEIFPTQLGEVSVEQFVDAINASKPSFVRTEADELTYPIHILIRYQIEKGLFNGTISPIDLDKTWNKLYKEYLGIEVTDPALGILQDVHWSSGSFGYFPTYALGSAFAAQFFDAMSSKINVAELLRDNHYDQVIAWLKENIHRYGALYPADKITKMSTGKDFDPDYYLDYLEEKYTKLYNL